jgi:hypothetical protein
MVLNRDSLLKQRTFEPIQTGTLVNGFDSTYNQITISGSTRRNPPRLTGTWTNGNLSSPFMYDMAPDVKSFSGALLGCNILTYFREQG